jgi:hypothetical protein
MLGRNRGVAADITGQSATSTTSNMRSCRQSPVPALASQVVHDGSHSTTFLLTDTAASVSAILLHHSNTFIAQLFLRAVLVLHVAIGLTGAWLLCSATTPRAQTASNTCACNGIASRPGIRQSVMRHTACSSHTLYHL